MAILSPPTVVSRAKILHLFVNSKEVVLKSRREVWLLGGSFEKVLQPAFKCIVLLSAEEVSRTVVATGFLMASGSEGLLAAARAMFDDS